MFNGISARLHICTWSDSKTINQPTDQQTETIKPGFAEYYPSQFDLKQAQEKLADLEERLERRRRGNSTKEAQLRQKEDELEAVRKGTACRRRVSLLPTVQQRSV